MTTLTVRKIGNSLGVVLPREVLTKLQLAEGDRLFVSETSDGMRMNRSDPAFEAKMAAAHKVMAKRYAALRELAK